MMYMDNKIKMYRLLTEARDSLNDRFLTPTISEDVRPEINRINEVLEIMEG